MTFLEYVIAYKKLNGAECNTWGLDTTICAGIQYIANNIYFKDEENKPQEPEEKHEKQVRKTVSKTVSRNSGSSRR